MNGETHRQLANFIWSICNLLRGPYKRNEYRKVILPLTVLRRFECLLEPTRQAALKEFQTLRNKAERVRQARLQKITGRRFYNLSQMQFTLPGKKIHSLLDDPNNLAPNLNSYIHAFSPNVRAIMEKFKFGEYIAHIAEKNILFEVVKAFAKIDLSPQRVDQIQMGYAFEELIRIGAEQSNEEAGEHFTPREVIKLMVNLLLAPEQDLGKSHVVKTIYDPAGGMLSVAEEYVRQFNTEAPTPSFSARTGTTKPGPSASPTCLSRVRMPTTSSWATPSPGTALSATLTAPHGPSITCWPIHPLAWSGDSRRSTSTTRPTPWALPGVSGPAHRASTTAPCSFCST
jgi:type I restriction enzyme M protein